MDLVFQPTFFQHPHLPSKDFCSWAAFCSAALFSTTTPAGEYPPRNRLSLVAAAVADRGSTTIHFAAVILST